MGNSLSLAEVQAFRDELLKTASIRGELATLASRFRNPGKGLRDAWSSMAPTGVLRGSAGSARQKQLSGAIARTRAAQGQKGVGAALKRTFGAGTHLDASTKGKGISGAAEELSRRGWTGEGRLTKYVPIGEKGGLAVSGLMGAQGIRKAIDQGPDEYEGGVSEQIGRQAGYILPSIATAGLPVIGFAGPLVASSLAASAGRKADQRIGRASRNKQQGPAMRLSRNPQVNRELMRRMDRMVDHTVGAG